MLIFDSRRGKFGTQKPKQWGPLSAVRSAVFRNATDIGIDPSKVVAYFPFWEGSGEVFHNIVGTPFMDGAGGVWNTNGSLSFNQTHTQYVADNTNGKYSMSGPFSVFVIAAITGANIGNNRQEMFGSGGFYDYWSVERANYDNTYVYIKIAGSYTTRYVYAPAGMADGNFGRILATFDGDSTAVVYGNGVAGVPVTNIVIPRGEYGSDLKIRQDISSVIPANSVFYKQLIIIRTELTSDHALLFEEAPYFLLQPNPTPLIFDWGAASYSDWSDTWSFTTADGWVHKINGVSASKVYGVEPTKVMGV